MTGDAIEPAGTSRRAAPDGEVSPLAAAMDNARRGIPLPFPRVRLNVETGDYCLRVGPSRTDVDPADPRSWQWVRFTAAHRCTNQRYADHHSWGPVWIDAVLVPTGVDASVPTATADMRPTRQD